MKLPSLHPLRAARSHPRAARWTCGVAATLAALLVLLAWTDWNWLREPLARRVSAATGRSFAINGDLQVHLSPRARVVAHDVQLGNAAWAAQPYLAQVERIELRIDLLQLLLGRIDLPELSLSRPRVTLETDAGGSGNWVFTPAVPGSRPPAVAIGSLSVDAGSATYRAAGGTDLAVAVEPLAHAAAPSPYGVAFTVKGRYRDLPVAVSGRGGALLQLRGTVRPYPIEAGGTVGATQFGIDGVLLDPLRLKGEQLNFRLAGSDLALLFPLIGVALPPTGPYKLAGHLDHAGDVWTFRRFAGTLGRSDIGGDVSLDRGRTPQKLTASLLSRTLVLRDLAGFIGAPVADGRVKGPRSRLLPAEPLHVDRLMAADVDLRFRGDKVITAGLPIERMSAHLVIDGGLVKLAPLEFGVAGGSLAAIVDIDARAPRMATRARITATGLRLDRLFPASSLAGRGTGSVGGHAALSGRGNSLAAMLGTAEGDAALIMEGGSVGELALRMSNLDVANSLLLLVGGDRQVSVRCMVGTFKATAGRFDVQDWVMDTAKVNLAATGHVDFGDESLHLSVASKSKGFSLASLRGPIAVTGTFAQPLVRPQLQEGILRGGLAVALGIASGGLAALLPLLDAGGARDSPCAALAAQARQQGGAAQGRAAAPATGR